MFLLQIRNLSELSQSVPQALRSNKARSTRGLSKHYVDACRMAVMGGRGGDGCVSFLSAFCKEYAGPNGGDGGCGGHVLFTATKSVSGLNHCEPVVRAQHGGKGGHRDCDGKNATHVVVPVPVGTIIRDIEGNVVGDLNKEDMIFVAARGGAGGKGNKYFTTATEQAPEVAEYGAEGENQKYTLEVRSMAHIGLIGFPNAGKSTLLRAITRARPKVAPYPFTTLYPHVGMVPYDDYEQVAIADLPGLIPGSHKNYGLGIQFLQHAERCCGFLFLIDTSDSEPWEHYENLRYEMGMFNKELLKRRKCIVANKVDLPESADNLKKIQEYFKNEQVIPVSGKVGTNLRSLLRTIRTMYDEGNKENVEVQ